MEITAGLLLPITDAQMTAFSIWDINTYGTYNVYLGASNTPSIDRYIRTYMLPLEMKSVLRETEPYIGVKNGDIHIARLLLYRKRILDKIKYMKGKLGKLVFPIESAQIRIDRRDAIIRRRQAQEALYLQQQQHFAAYAEAVRLGLDFLPESGQASNSPTIVKKYLSEEEALMDDDCVICMVQHKMTDACNTNCGHQFGRACLTKWSNMGPRCYNGAAYKCPLCRTDITEITEFSYEVEVDDALGENSLFDQVMNSII
jgi:hypothetical protein